MKKDYKFSPNPAENITKKISKVSKNNRIFRINEARFEDKKVKNIINGKFIRKR